MTGADTRKPLALSLQRKGRYLARCIRARAQRYRDDRELVASDAFPMHREPNPTRSCKTCGKEQRRLPGYGGSEIGFWIDK